MTAVSCSDFPQQLFMNKTQHHFIHCKLSGCFAILSIIKLFVSSCLFHITVSCLSWLCIIQDMLFSFIYNTLRLLFSSQTIPIRTTCQAPSRPITTCQASAASQTASSLRWLRETWRPPLRLAPESAVSRSPKPAGKRGRGQMMAFFDLLFSSLFDLFAYISYMFDWNTRL